MSNLDAVDMIEKRIVDIPEHFEAMAVQITRNDVRNFGGAFVIVPPANGGDPIQTLILDSNQDPGQFWAILKTKAEMMIAEIEQQRANQAAWPGRR